jgi:hypothetical protein
VTYAFDVSISTLIIGHKAGQHSTNLYGGYDLKAILSAVLFAVLLVVPANAANGIFVYGCTSDKKPARIRVVAPIENKPLIEATFRRIIRGRTSEWFLAQKKAPSGADWQNTMAVLEQSSGGQLPKQLPALVARSIEIGKRSASQKLYCGN